MTAKIFLYRKLFEICIDLIILMICDLLLFNFYFTMETKSTKNGHRREGVHRPVHQQEGRHEQGGG